MNTAARLEGANKPLETQVLFSREALDESTLGNYRVMGRVRLRGRATPVEVFDAPVDFHADARQRLNDAYHRFEAGDLAALDEIRDLAAAHPRDAALRNLVKRLETVGPGGVFPLG
jgi:adenylate cyclase